MYLWLAPIAGLRMGVLPCGYRAQAYSSRKETKIGSFRTRRDFLSDAG
jgi:hypothetical protein